MRRARSLPTILMAALIGAAASPVVADAAKNAEGVAALRAILANPDAPVSPTLSQFDFLESHYLVDGLTFSEQRRLRNLLHEYSVKLPSGVASALRIKAPRARSR